MALADFLRAIKELIFELDELPDNRDVRYSWLKRLYPELTVEELRDLSTIQKTKLNIYRRSIISIEASIIKHRLVKSLAFLKGNWQSVYKTQLKLEEEILAAQRKFCWQGYLTVELFKSFKDYLLSERREIFQSFPNLEALIDYEVILYQLKRAPDCKEDLVSQEELSKIKIEDLFQRKIIIPVAGRLFKSQYQLSELHLANTQKCEITSYWIFRSNDYQILQLAITQQLAESMIESQDNPTTFDKFLERAAAKKREQDHNQLLREILAIALHGGVGFSKF
jgi:hypothetical protein